MLATKTDWKLEILKKLTHRQVKRRKWKICKCRVLRRCEMKVIVKLQISHSADHSDGKTIKIRNPGKAYALAMSWQWSYTFCSDNCFRILQRWDRALKCITLVCLTWKRQGPSCEYAHTALTRFFYSNFVLCTLRIPNFSTHEPSASQFRAGPPSFKMAVFFVNTTTYLVFLTLHIIKLNVYT